MNASSADSKRVAATASKTFDDIKIVWGAVGVGEIGVDILADESRPSVCARASLTPSISLGGGAAVFKSGQSATAVVCLIIFNVGDKLHDVGFSGGVALRGPKARKSDKGEA